MPAEVVPSKLIGWSAQRHRVSRPARRHEHRRVSEPAVGGGWPERPEVAESSEAKIELQSPQQYRIAARAFGVEAASKRRCASPPQREGCGPTTLRVGRVASFVGRLYPASDAGGEATSRASGALRMGRRRARDPKGRRCFFGSQTAFGAEAANKTPEGCGTGGGAARPTLSSRRCCNQKRRALRLKESPASAPSGEAARGGGREAELG